MSKARLLAVLGLGLILAYAFGLQPSNDRNWTADQKVLAQVEQVDDLYDLSNVRDFHYRSESDYDIRYTTRTVPLKNIQGIDLLLSAFGEHRALAHVYLSFTYTDLEGALQRLVVSVEIRKEEGEQYSPIWGLFRQYELSYVLGTERDLILLRTNHRQEPTFLFPIKTPPEKAQALFASIMHHVHRLETEAEFYNTLTNACGTNIMQHVNAVRQEPVPWTYRFVLPGYADALALDLGLIEGDISEAELRERFAINELAQTFGDKPGFSEAIRQGR